MIKRVSDVTDLTGGRDAIVVLHGIVCTISTHGERCLVALFRF